MKWLISATGAKFDEEGKLISIESQSLLGKLFQSLVFFLDSGAYLSIYYYFYDYHF